MCRSVIGVLLVARDHQTTDGFIEKVPHTWYIQSQQHMDGMTSTADENRAPPGTTRKRRFIHGRWSNYPLSPMPSNKSTPSKAWCNWTILCPADCSANFQALFTLTRTATSHPLNNFIEIVSDICATQLNGFVWMKTSAHRRKNMGKYAFIYIYVRI